MNKSGLKAVNRAGLVLLAVALVTIVLLVASDTAHGLRLTTLHSRLGSVALITVGLSYVCLQAVARGPRDQRVRGVILGGAFALWGIEQLLPANRSTTAMDTAVIAVFVVDLGMIILDGLDRPARE